MSELLRSRAKYCLCLSQYRFESNLVVSSPERDSDESMAANASVRNALTALQLSKQHLRKEVTAALGKLTAEQSKTQSSAVVTKLLALDVYKKSKAVAVYLSMGTSEVDTSPIVADIF